MTLQTAAPLTTYNLQASARIAKELATMVVEGHMWLDAPYQRGSVWSVDQQRALVKSWAIGLPVPAIVVNDRGTRAWHEANGALDQRYVVIDGKQRVTAAVAWFYGGLTVPASWFAPEDVVETVETEDGPYVTFEGLSPTFRRVFWLTLGKLPMVEAKVATEAEEAMIYGLLNTGGTAQTQDDLDRAARIANGEN